MKNSYILLVLFFAGLGFASCDKNDGTAQAALKAGTYTGEFSRFSPDGRCTPANVTLVLENNTFLGYSDMAKFPAIGTGSYKLSGAEIEFTDRQIWTAEFDWTYILNGKFKMKAIGDELIIVRMYNNQVTDMYRLHRQDPAATLNTRVSGVEVSGE
jgi:hypothetical protein